MAQVAPNASVGELVTTTSVFRQKEIADNITNNNAVLDYLTKGEIESIFDGGREVQEAMDYEETRNVGWYAGEEPFPMEQQEVLTAARYPIRQAYGTVAIDGLTSLLNMGTEAKIDIANKRLKNMQKTMKNFITRALYGDGMGGGGKAFLGLDVLVPENPASGIVGGINRANHEFWRSKRGSRTDDLDASKTPGANKVYIEDEMVDMWQKTCRGMDKIDLIVADNGAWKTYWRSLQTDRRFTSDFAVGRKIGAHWRTLEFMGVPVIMDGGIGGNAPLNQMYMLNTSGFHWRPVKGRNFTVRPKTQVAPDQDVMVTVMLFAGCFTASWLQGSGRIGKDVS